jgi:spermidine synthase
MSDRAHKASGNRIANWQSLILHPSSFILPAFLLLLAPATPLLAKAGLGGGAIEADVKSDYSHIRVRRQGSMRSMNFVRDNGEEHIQSVLNTKRPYELITNYSRVMFASYLFMPQPKRVLIVGLGGGAMVHFFEHYDPNVKVDAVEIDPKVVELADKYFDVRTQKNVKIITDDAFKYFQENKTGENKTRYDVIYMDAFLKPSEDTDATGQPLRLKTTEFYKGLRDQLTPDGIVVINLNVFEGTKDDVATVRAAYPQMYTFRATSPNLIVVGTWEKSKTSPADLRARAKALDQRFKATFSFQSVVGTLGR